MNKKELTQEQFNELCCAGSLKFVNHNLWLITWLTFFKKLAVCQDVRTDECEIIELVVKQ